MRYDLSSATSDSIELATAAAITEAERHVTAAVAADGDPSTVHHLDEAMRVVLDAGGYGPFLMHGDPDESVRDAGAAAAETLGKWTSDLVFRREIFEAVSAVDPSAVTGLEARSLDEWRRDLRRAGHELSAEDRETLRGLRTRLIELEIAFSKNIADFSDGIDLGPDDRAGLPGSLLESLPEGSTDGTLRVTLDYPAYTPFMQQSARRDLRQTLQYKFYNQAVDTNRPLLEEAIEVRTHIADLLGYDDWAEHQLETEMADSGAVEEMYRSIVPGLTARARHEKAALETMLHADAPGAVLSAWDWAYYDTQQAKADFGVDQNEIAEYFPLETTIDGMFEITGTVFGIRYEPAPDEPVWHDDVRAYRVID
ncbi:MAG: hypothetical protein KDB69_07710, partial [Acidimicrobiia bacterium]|nr:hypothetical protein [Acidimicrobiia bacterium]